MPSCCRSWCAMGADLDAAGPSWWAQQKSDSELGWSVRAAMPECGLVLVLRDPGAGRLIVKTVEVAEDQPRLVFESFEDSSSEGQGSSHQMRVDEAQRRLADIAPGVLRSKSRADRVRMGRRQGVDFDEIDRKAITLCLGPRRLSFRAAARELGVSRQTVSRAVRRSEKKTAQIQGRES